jgi:hypothetical protein
MLSNVKLLHASAFNVRQPVQEASTQVTAETHEPHESIGGSLQVRGRGNDDHTLSVPVFGLSEGQGGRTERMANGCRRFTVATADREYGGDEILQRTQITRAAAVAGLIEGDNCETRRPQA